MFTRLQHAEYMKEVWYPRNRKKHQRLVKQNVARLQMKLRDYKSARGCSRCPENFHHCLDFHHKSGRKKLGDVAVSQLAHRYGSWKRIMKEVRKCIILCANCHRKETFKLAQESVAGSSSPVQDTRPIT